MGKWGIDMAGITAAVASLAYLIRVVRRLAAVVTSWEGLPARHEELAKATADNTAAIRDLITAVARLSAAEESIANGAAGRKTP